MKADFAARYGWYRRASVDYESMPYMPEESNLTLEEARAAADKTLFDTYGVHIDDLSMREDSRYLKDARGIGYWQFSYWGKIKIGEQEYFVEIFEISQTRWIFLRMERRLFRRKTVCSLFYQTSLHRQFLTIC